MTWDPANPLAPMPGEPDRANEALVNYWRLGPNRSIAKAGDGMPPPVPCERTLWAWANRWHWRERMREQIALERHRDMEMLAELRDHERRKILAEYDRVKEAAWREWERSREDQTQTHVAKSGDGENQRPHVSKTTARSLGDPRYLKVIIEASANQRQMLGLDMPTQVDLNVRPAAHVSRESQMAVVLARIAERTGDTRIIDVVEEEIAKLEG